MAEDVTRFQLPPIAALRWLADPGSHVPADMHEKLLLRMFSGARVIVMGIVNSIVLSGVALAMHCGWIFGVFIAVDVVVCILRVRSVREANRAIENGAAPRMTSYMLTGIVWSGLQGMIGFTAMQTHNSALQFLAAVQIFGIIGPICARNYPAPRYCLLLVCLCDLSLVAGCVLSGDHWLLITVPETPLFLLGVQQVTKNFQLLAVSSLKAELESQYRATHDPLTGLLNRRGLTEAIDQQTPPEMASLALIALDLDGFKTVNDTFGHHVGDGLLKAVAERLGARMRPHDTVIRLGGDEFIIIAKNIPPQAVSKLCDRIINDIGGKPYLIGDAPPVTVGVSIGFACAPHDGDDVETLHRHADAALYAAKASGRGVHRRHQHLPMEQADIVSATDRPEPRHLGANRRQAAQSELMGDDARPVLGHATPSL